MEPLLSLIPRVQGSNDPALRGRSRRIRRPYSPLGEIVLLSFLKVHEEFNVGSLESMFDRHLRHLRNAMIEVSGTRSCRGLRYIYTIREKLGIPKKEHAYTIVPVEEMLEPFRSEIETYRLLAPSIGEDKSPEEMRWEEFFIARANQFNITVTNHSPTTVRNAVKGLQQIYGRLQPLIEDKQMSSFSVKDLLRISSKPIEHDGEVVTFDCNIFMDALREEDREKANRYKRRGFDSGTIENAINWVKYIGTYNGFFALLGPFSKAYENILLDQKTIDVRKQNKKNVFSIKYLDAQIERLRPRVLDIIKKGLYIRRPGFVQQANRNLNICLFYTDLLMMRYLSYRQQCLRNCKYGKNIVFWPDGAITLSWHKDEVKNDRAISVTLTKERNKGAWGLLIEALHLYHKKIYRYVEDLSRESGTWEALEGQFFVHLDISGNFVRFQAEDPGYFYRWFTEWADECLILPGEALENDIYLNPHHLRAICMDWMYLLGMTAEEISTTTGITKSVIEGKYFNKDRVFDATRVIASTDRRLKAEARSEVDVLELIEKRDAAYHADLARRDWENEELHKENESLRGEIEELKAEREKRVAKRGKR
jgi:hypothetical protein